MTDTPPPADRFPPSGFKARTKEERIPTLMHLLPGWYPTENFVGVYYRDQLGDNTVYHDEASARHAATNEQNNTSSLHNFEYKQEKPHDRHTPLSNRRPGQPDAPAPLQPHPANDPAYRYEIREPGATGEVPTGSHK